MKNSTIAALAGLGGLALYLKSRDGASAAKVDPFADIPAGQFDPNTVSSLPDFEEVTNAWQVGMDGFFEYDPSRDAELDWMYTGFPPGFTEYNARIEEAGALNNPTAGYYNQMWAIAKRIKLSSINRTDIARAGSFLAGEWKSGAGAGAVTQSYDEYFGTINELLETEAAGLDIGTAIGVGLASIFGFGEGAKAADSSFGFGRGAAEDRGAMVDLKNIKIASGELGVQSAFGPAGTAPNGKVWGSPLVRVGGGILCGAYPGLFYGNFKKYETGHASKTANARHQIEARNGQMYIQLGYVFPWYAAEMSAAQPLPERMYTRARMLRTLDLICARLYGLGEAFDTAGGFEPDGNGNLVPATVVKRYRWSYVSKRFGKLDGSLFPWLVEDKVQDAVTNVPLAPSVPLLSTVAPGTLAGANPGAASVSGSPAVSGGSFLLGRGIV